MARRLVQSRLRRDQALWARIYILKRGRSRLKENPLLGEVPGYKPYVYGDFYPFDPLLSYPLGSSNKFFLPPLTPSVQRTSNPLNAWWFDKKTDWWVNGPQNG